MRRTERTHDLPLVGRETIWKKINFWRLIADRRTFLPSRGPAARGTAGRQRRPLRPRQPSRTGPQPDKQCVLPVGKRGRNRGSVFRRRKQPAFSCGLSLRAHSVPRPAGRGGVLIPGGRGVAAEFVDVEGRICQADSLAELDRRDGHLVDVAGGGGESKKLQEWQWKEQWEAKERQ